MDENLMKEARELGINASMYYLLPTVKREAALQADINREKARRKENDEANQQSKGTQCEESGRYR